MCKLVSEHVLMEILSHCTPFDCRYVHHMTKINTMGDTISCNGTERNETKRNDFVSCFSNYYRDITILRNETIPFRFVPFRF
jgi:hypothetical protein